MAKNSIRDYSATNSSNTDIQSIDISEGCSPAGINNAIREVMADLKDVSTGAVALESPKFDSILDGNIKATDASGTDTAGTATTIKGGAGTGTGAGGSIIFQVADGAGSTGSSVNAHATAMTITDDGNVDIAGGLNVGTIKEATGTTTALTIASNGLVKHPQRPIFSVRGRANSTSLTAADANFDYITSWTTTDINVGGLLNAGGYAQVPTGFGGNYQITWITNSQTSGSLNYNSAYMYHYDGSTYTLLMQHFASNDYANYSTGTTFLYPLDEGDIIYAGYDDRYSVPHAGDARSNFSMMFVG